MGRHFVILHGWQGNAPDHWQTWLAERLQATGAPVCYPVLPDPDHPRLEPWIEALETLLPPDREATVVCHSLACLLWLHHLARGGRQARGAARGAALRRARPARAAGVLPGARGGAGRGLAAGVRGRRPVLPRRRGRPLRLGR